MFAYFFLLYADYELYPDTQRFKNRVKFQCIPVVINFVLAVSSFWNGVYFIINENNSYERGSLFYVPVVISSGYMLYILGIIMKYKREIQTIWYTVPSAYCHQQSVFPFYTS